jgi:hypothetical protein
MEWKTPKGVSRNAAIWVLVVIGIGPVVGGGLAWGVHVPPNRGPGGPPGPPPPSMAATRANVLLSSLAMVLLIALLVVYARIYRMTRAPYVLGLLVVLGALFCETALISPLLFTAFGLGPGNLGRFLALSDLLLSAGLAIFLYLSLQ